MGTSCCSVQFADAVVPRFVFIPLYSARSDKSVPFEGFDLPFEQHKKFATNLFESFP
jgi:hypothetical protein